MSGQNSAAVIHYKGEDNTVFTYPERSMNLSLVNRAITAAQGFDLVNSGILLLNLIEAVQVGINDDPTLIDAWYDIDKAAAKWLVEAAVSPERATNETLEAIILEMAVWTDINQHAFNDDLVCDLANAIIFNSEG